jgi:hypothetical protein
MVENVKVPYRESDAFRASRARTAKKRYWRDPEKVRQQRRETRRRKKSMERN